MDGLMVGWMGDGWGLIEIEVWYIPSFTLYHDLMEAFMGKCRTSSTKDPPHPSSTPPYQPATSSMGRKKTSPWRKSLSPWR